MEPTLPAVQQIGSADADENLRTGEVYEPLLLLVNSVVGWFRRTAWGEGLESVDPDLREIRLRAREGTDISAHLETLFLEGMLLRPRLIVELGVRDGQS